LYPFSTSSSARYDPSCPAIQAMIALRDFWDKCLLQDGR
jgi:hypothetical protein